MNPILFLLKMPFRDIEGDERFCSHCAMIEGAIAINPHWQEHVEIRRIENSKPRKEVVEILGLENQWLPVLVLPDKSTIKDPIKITTYLAKNYGGASPHA